MAGKPTVSLQMIIKDEFDAVLKIVSQAYQYFDELNFTVSDKKTAEKLADVMQKQDKVHVEHRPWNNRFDEARNDNLKMCHTTYWFWVDADDEFPFESIPRLVQIAENGGYDQLLLGYNYGQNELGQCVAFHWRERLLRRDHPFTWKGWVHETPITQLPFKAHRVGGVVVVHKSDDAHNEVSLKRNHQILLQATKESDDPRYQLYYGTSCYSLGDYGEALQVLNAFIEVSGNTEDIYRALCCMSECAAHLKEKESAVRFAVQAALAIPEFPQAYRLLAQWEMEDKRWDEALEWARTADSKPLNQGFGVFDPTVKDQICLIAMHCEFMRGNFNKALKWLRKLDADNPARKDFEEDMLNEADAETFVSMLPKVRKFFKSDEELYASLVPDLQYDTRLRGLRDLVVEPKTWGDKSIVILCGESYDEQGWGPHTLKNGMGGSEEAVVYLSRELARMGWDVTIYGAVKEKLTDGKGVTYIPWKEINKSDNFNIFVAWRAPDFAEHIKAKVKVADIHDLQKPQNFKPYDDLTYFFKSNYHRNYYPDIKRARIIGNGISKEQFND